MMKLTKGLENIHSIIDRHEAEWRKEQGEPVEELNAITLEETVRRRLADNNKNSKGRFSADRFLGASPKTKTPKTEIKEPEQNNEIDETSENFEGGVEVVSVIKQDENKNHSWLYNEVVKAVNNAAGTDKNVKVVAVFVPVVQNGKEFEDLPVDNVVTTQPVNEEEIKFEEKDLLKAEQTEQINEPVEAQEDFNLVPEGQDEPDAELADAFQTMEEKLDETLQEQIEQDEQNTEIPEAFETEEPQEEIVEEVLEEPEESDEPEILPHENIETLHLANKVKEPEVVEPVEPVEAEKTELIEEVLEEIEEPSAAKTEKTEETEETDEAEKSEELPLPPLPDELDDDEVFDETKFSNPVEAVQLIEGDEEENDESIISDDEEGFTFEDALETNEEVTP